MKYVLEFLYVSCRDGGAKSTTLSGSSNMFAATWLIEKLVIWSWKRGSSWAVVEDGHDLRHEGSDILVVFVVRQGYEVHCIDNGYIMLV